MRSTNRFYGFTAFLVTFFCLMGCEPAPKAWAPKPGTVEYKIAQIGDSTVAAHYPEYNRRRFPIRIEQKGDRWIFHYRLPENAMGGTPIVEIDKRTFKVLEIYETQ